MLRSLPPAGVPLQGEDILSGLRCAWSGDDPVERFQGEIRRYFMTRYSFLVPSGKAGLAVVLHALNRISNRREVIIPAFSSFCLPSAVAKVGLRIKLCDISPGTLDFDLDRLKRIITDQTLCVIPVHLFGLSSQVDVIQAMAKSKGAYVIEDAAQAAGGRLNGRKLGTIGDIGIFSLGRGKNITTVDGGVIVTESSPLAAEIQRSIEMLVLAGGQTGAQVRATVKALALAIFLHPRFYWFPERLPFLQLGASEFSPGFQIGPYSRFQAGLGISMLARLDNYNEVRRANAAYLLDQLKGVNGFRIPQPIPGSLPVYLRFPLLVEDPAVRQLAYRTLVARGLGASKTYPTALNAIQDLHSYAVGLDATYPGAEGIAERLLTLPTHPYVAHRDLERMAQAMRSLRIEAPAVRSVKRGQAETAFRLGSGM